IIATKHQLSFAVVLSARDDYAGAQRGRRRARVSDDGVPTELDAGREDRRSVSRIEVEEDPGPGIADDAVAGDADVERRLPPVGRPNVHARSRSTGKKPAPTEERVALDAKPDRAGGGEDVALAARESA